MLKRYLLLTLTLFLFSGFHSNAQTWTQIGGDIDGEAAGDSFGGSVSLSSDGSTVAIGARLNDGNGTSAGHVRVFQRAGNTWTQVGADIDGQAAGDQFGGSVSLNSNGTVIAIGATGNDGNGLSSGHVKIYKNINGVWTQQGSNIVGEAAYDYSGASVSLSSDGSIVAIGASGNDGNGSMSGHVRIYRNINGTWIKIGSDIDGEVYGDNSGYPVSLSSNGNIVAIGATWNDGNGTNSGHIRIYENINNSWTQIGTDIDGEASYDYSGVCALSSDGSTVAIGAESNDGNGSNSGHVRIYKNTNGTWIQQGSDLDGEAVGDFSGKSVSLSNDGSTVAIGANSNDGNGTNAGHVRIYKNINGPWTQVGSDIDGEAADDRSGSQVALSSDGSTVAIGAPSNDGNGADAGHVRVYTLLCSGTLYSIDSITSCGPYTWIDGNTYLKSNNTATHTVTNASGCDSIVTLNLEILSNGPSEWIKQGSDIDGEASGDLSGWSVSLSSDGNTLAIGARDNYGDAGQVRIYEKISGTWTQIGTDIDGEALNDRSGWSVSLSSDGSTVAVGAPYNGWGGTEAGHVRVYRNINGTWTQVGADIDGVAGSWSGYSVSLNSDGSTVAIGAVYNLSNGTQAGDVKIFKNVGGTWTQLGADIVGESAVDQSGYSVSLSSDGNTVAIGAPLNDGNGIDAGHVRIYENINGTWTQVGADIDGEAASDQSGKSVSLSSDGSTVAIGAPYNDGNGANAGHVRIYKNINGTWTLLGSDIDGESQGDNSGYSVSLSSDGSSVAIGAIRNNGNGMVSGHVRIYKNMNGLWTQIGSDIDGEASGDNSGCSVSLSSDGSTVAIGAYTNDGNGTSAGHVRVYSEGFGTVYSIDTITSCGPYSWIDGITYSKSNNTATHALTNADGCDSIILLNLSIAGTWSQLGSDIDGEAALDNFGESVSISSDGSTIAIGAPGNDGNGTDAGHVRIFKNTNGSWTLQGSEIEGVWGYDRSGIAVSLSNDGNTLAIGANGNDDNGSSSGHVRIFRNINGSWTQQGSDFDGEAASDNFGESVSLSGDGSTLAIGARYNDGNGQNAGHVRVYKTYNGGSTWYKLGPDIDGEAAWDWSGTSVSINNDGTIVAIGAPLNDGNGLDAGHVRVYKIVNGTWTQLGSDIDGEAAGDKFGTSVSLSSDGSILAIGAPLNDGNGADAGHVRVYENDNGTWVQVGIDIDGDDAGDACGESVSLNTSGNILAVGAVSNNGNGTDAGYVRIYKNLNGTWTQQQSHIYGEEAGDNFGASVSLSSDGNTIAIGAPLNDGNGSDAGHVRVYKIDTTGLVYSTDTIISCGPYTWIDGKTYTVSNNTAMDTIVDTNGCYSVVTLNLTINPITSGTDVITACDSYTWIDGNTYTFSNYTATHTLINQYGCDSIVTLHLTIIGSWTQVGSDIDGEAPYDYSGRSVSISSDGSILAIGATGNDGNGIGSGHVRIYENISGTWTQVGTDIDGEAIGDASGQSVSLSRDGNIVAIGAFFNDGNGTSAGHVRVFKNVSGIWTQIGGDIDGEAATDYFGESVSLSSDGNTVAVGAPQNDGNGTNAGHVRIYKNITGTWTQVGADIDGEAAFDRSGSSVSLSSDGNTVAIGAYYNDGNGTDAGHVRIYNNMSGTWTQVGADIDGEAADDRSGQSVSLSSDGNTVAIGAWNNDGNGSSSGHARVYHNVNGTWTQVGSDIDGEAPYDYSGYSVSLSSDGSTVAIGAYANNGNGTDAGHVRVYKNISGTWTQQSDDYDGESVGDWSGYSVSLNSDGSTVAIGAERNSGNGVYAGHVRVYQFESVGSVFSIDTINSCGPYTWIDGVTYTTSNYTATDTLVSASGCDSIVTLHLSIPSTWNQVGLDIDGEATFDQSGRSVSLSSDGSVMAIGGYVNDGNGIDAGHVRVYKNLSGIWSQVGSDIDGELAQDRSGECVSLSSDGSTVAIGAIYNDGNGTDAGHVRVYKNINNSWIQVGSDIDGEAASDWFGYSVSLSNDGNTLAVGGYTNDGNGTDAGHVRIYKNINGTWIQLGTDIDGEAAGDHSGYSVSLNSDGSVVAIGAPFNDGNGTSSGHVRVFKNLNGTWTQQGLDIDGEAVGDGSGFMVSLSGDGSIVAIGSPYNDGNGIDAGHVRIYENINGTWTQVGADIDGEAAGDRSGWSFSLNGNGNTVAVGAIYNDGNGTNAGHVRIYSNINGIWTQQGSDIDGESSDDWSGYSVSLSNDGSTAAIGAIKNDGNGTDAGHVRVFKIQGIGALYSTDTITSCGPYTWIDGVTYTNSNYTATDTLVSTSGCDSIITLNLTVIGNGTQVGSDIDGEAAWDASGYSVSLSSDGSTVAIGAFLNAGNGSQSGNVRIFKNISGTWTQQGADIDGEAAGDWSGWSVSLSSDGNTVAIGAPHNDGNGSSSGHVRIYKNISGSWTQQGSDIDGEAAGDQSGNSVSLSSDGSTVAIGATRNDGNGTYAGHVRIYKNISGTWTQVGTDIDGEAAYDRFGGSVSLSSDGSTVAIGARLNDGNGTSAGHVRIYKNISGAWIQVGADIDGEAAGDYSGRSVSLSSDGSTVAIGATGNDGNGSHSGHVRIYKNISGSWTQQGADIDGEAAADQSGSSVSLSSDGSTVAIGALYNAGNGSESGHVRIYENINGTWTQVGADIDGEAAGDRSGYSVSLSSDGSTVAIGAHQNDGNGSKSGHVRVYNIESATYITDTITSCGPYTWIDGVTYTTGNYTATDTLVSASGCDSIVTLHLTINSSNTGTDVITACDSYTWIDGNTYTASNNSATYTLTNAAGCDSVVTLDLTINSSNTGTDVITACDSYTWIDGNTYTASNNSATYTLTNAAGCDSVVTLDLTINSSNTGTDVITACDSYTWIDGNTYTASNNSATYTLANAAGCDSVVTLDLTINSSNTGTDVITACDSYTWIDGLTYTASNNSATYTLTNAAGCDSVVTLDLTINSSNTGTDVITACDSYTWIDGLTYTASNNSATYTLTNAAGCDSVVTLDLTINSSNTGTDVITACDSYTWIDGNTYTASNNSATYTLTNAAGCDSVVTLDLTINSSNTGTDVITACDSYTWIDGLTYTASNNSATYTLTNAAGCDSVVTLDLTINSSNTGTDVITACDSYTWIDGNTYTASNNTATYTLTNVNGCDSVVTLDLTINSSNTSTDVITACDSYTWIDGNTYTASINSATYTLTNAAGCDSVVTLDLTINSSNTGTDVITACDSYTWIDGNTYTASNNTATYTLTNAAGCDSVVTLDLTINSSNTGTDVITACDSYTWIDGNTYTSSNNSATYVLNNVNGCDSVVSLDLTITYSNTGQVSLNGCDQLSLNGQTYTVSGTYIQNLVNSDGCDSILTINANITYSNFIQSQPTNQSVGEGLNAVFLIVGPPTAQYQWQTNLGLGYQNLNDFGQYSGTTTSSLQVSNVNLLINNNQAFRCLVTEGNCTDTSGTVILEVVPSSSVNEFEQGINIYPNPTQGIVKVELKNSTSTNDIYQLQLVDSHGKLIQNSLVNFQDGFIVINIEDYPAGVYQLTLKNQYEVFHEKISKVH